MQCSARKFLASQALYGAQIAHPDWSHDQLVEEAVTLSSKLIKRLDSNDNQSPHTRHLPKTRTRPVR